MLKPGLSSALLAVLISLLVAGDVLSEIDLRAFKEHVISVAAEPIDFDRTTPDTVRFGRLTWRGGVVLTSDAKEFGGYSGVAVTDNGKRMIALSDQGTWLAANLTYDKGLLSGVANARTGPLRSKNGKNLRRKKDADAEEVALWQSSAGAYALVSFERDHRIGRFPLAGNSLEAPVSFLDLPKDLSKTDPNKGLEAMTVLADKTNKGTVLAFAEHLLDDNGDHTGWLIRGKAIERVRLKRHDDFDVTGLATLPNGNVVVLERSFSMLAGVAMRLSEIDVEHIKPGARLDGRELLRANMGYNIDNMEGVSVHRNAKGETILTLVSDNNFNTNGLQRTLLMQFRLD